MLVSENLLKWAMRFYPPLLLQRIWVIRFDKDFRGVKVKIAKSILNKNYNNSIFGGTILAAADPFYPVLFHQILLHKGYKVIGWSKSVEIQFMKPGSTNLYINIQISDEEIAVAENILSTTGRYVQLHSMNIVDKHGDKCAWAQVEVYIRNLKIAE